MVIYQYWLCNAMQLPRSDTQLLYSQLPEIHFNIILIVP